MHQEHFGKKFYLDKETGYWISTDYPRIRAHRWVYEYHYGPVEDGYHIHHIDGNKSNNDISNLKKLTEKDHLSMHMTIERKKWAAERMSKIQHLTKAWHASEEGKEWHSKHAKQTFARNSPEKSICDQCKKEFEIDKIDLKRTRFCSNKCKSKWRRDSGLDDIEIKCEKCGSLFMRNKYLKVRFCGKKCGSSRRKN
jgi:hypothetical protein